MNYFTVGQFDWEILLLQVSHSFHKFKSLVCTELMKLQRLVTNTEAMKLNINIKI